MMMLWEIDAPKIVALVRAEATLICCYRRRPTGAFMVNFMVNWPFGVQIISLVRWRGQERLIKPGHVVTLCSMVAQIKLITQPRLLFQHADTGCVESYHFMDAEEKEKIQRSPWRSEEQMQKVSHLAFKPFAVRYAHFWKQPFAFLIPLLNFVLDM